MAKKKFTTSLLNNVRYSGKSQIIRDSQTTGLAIRIGKLSKTFEFYYRFNGKLKREQIGRYPSVSLIEAKKQVSEFRLILDKGLPLNHEDKANMTFEELYAEWSKMKSRTIKKSHSHVDALLKNHILPSLADYKLSDLTIGVLLAPIEKRIEQGKTGVANIAFTRTKELLNYGIMKGYLTVNPLQAVTLKALGLKKESRDYVIPLDDMKRIYQCDINSLVVPMIRFMTLSFLRNNEIRLMKWEYIDFEERKLSLPKEVMKTRKAFDVYLTDTMIEILKAREKLREPHIEYVFFSKYDNKPLDATFVPTRYRDIKQATGLTEWRPHDLRRNVTHLVEQCGVDVYTADALLSHSLTRSSVANIYQRSSLWNERKQALIKWDDFLVSQKIIP